MFVSVLFFGNIGLYFQFPKKNRLQIWRNREILLLLPMREDNGQRRGATRERIAAVRQNFWSWGVRPTGTASRFLFIITEFAPGSIFLNGDSL